MNSFLTYTLICLIAPYLPKISYISSDVILYGKFLTNKTLFTSGGNRTFSLKIIRQLLVNSWLNPILQSSSLINILNQIGMEKESTVNLHSVLQGELIIPVRIPVQFVFTKISIGF